MNQHAPARADKPEIVVEDLMIPSDTAGISLHLRNKRSAALTTFAAERTILMMHGATYASESLFDTPLGGLSFMDHLAVHGYDVLPGCADCLQGLPVGVAGRLGVADLPGRQLQLAGETSGERLAAVVVRLLDLYE